MKNFLVAAVVTVLASSMIGLAQEASKPGKANPAAKSDQADGKKGRLPAHYGKVGLTEIQKQKIYGIQGQYDEQLDALEKQMDALKAKRDQEVEAVLTEDQRKIVKSLVDATKDAKLKSKLDAIDSKAESENKETKK